MRWRRTVERFLTLTRKTRACYGPLPPAPRPGTETFALPAPPLQRERLAQTYDWAQLAHRELGQFEEALAQFDAFFAHFGTSADSSRLAAMYHRRAYLRYRFGHLTPAIDDYTKTIAYTPAADTVARINLLTDLGIVLQKARDLSRARLYYTHAEKLARNLPPSAHSRELLARAIYNQGDILLEDTPGRDALQATTDRQQAIRRIEQALSLYPPDETERRARAHVGLGEAYGFDGDFDAAFRHLERGYQLAEQLNAPDVLALADLKLGKTHLTAGALDAAEEFLHRAADHARASGNNEYHRRTFHHLGRLHERREDWATAEAHYRQAIAVTKQLRASLRATDWAAAAFDQWVAPYRGLVRVLAKQNRYEDAFFALEQTRARHLQNLRQQARLTSTLPLRDRVRFDSLTTALADVRDQLARDVVSADAQNELTRQEVRLMAERRAVIDLDETLAMPPLDTLQQRLRPRGRAVVSYFIDAPSSYFGREAQSFAFLLTADTLRFVPLDITRDGLLDALSEISPLLTGAAPPDLNAVHFDLHALHAVYEQLYAPLADALPHGAPLVVVPDGPLFRLPFGMLVTEQPGRFAYTEARFLIAERPVTSELAATLLTDTAAVAYETAYDIVALGRSRFDALPTLPTSHRSRLDSTGGLPALPAVRRELEALGEMFAHGRILLDDAATEEALRPVQNETQVLHLASHALVHPNDPLANLFVLAPDTTMEAQHDGLLFLHEMERQRCATPLVVLSGCSTARGLLQTGEGPQGLQYAFRAGGAESTLSMLWAADDDAATALTTAFYRHLQDGQPKDIALQRAQLEYLSTHPERSSPFFWAGAVLYGDTRPLPLEAAAPFSLFALAAGGLVLLLVALGLGYARSRRHAF